MTAHAPSAISSPIGASYMRTAIVFAERAKLVEANPPKNAFEWTTLHRALVASSVLSSACALEATVNEWFSYSAEIRGRKVEAKRAQIAKLWELGIPRTASFQILSKYQIALTQLGLEIFDEGAEPYQNARSLVDLRNWLVHYEPSWEPTQDFESDGTNPPHKRTKRLKGKFPVNPLCHKQAPFWPYKCLGAGCAVWAAESAFAFMDSFFERADPKSTSRIGAAVFEKARKLGRQADWSAYGV